MSLFEWKPIFSVQIDSIDGQHKQLVTYMNGFFEAYSQNQTAEAKRHLNDLLEFTQKHFAHEEDLMGKTGYPDMASHVESHKNLLTLVVKFAQDYQVNPCKETGDKLGNFLKNWLSGHILGVDKKYSPHLRTHGYH